MAPKWHKSDKHLLPLALLAMFSLMIPVITTVNSNNQTRQAAAAQREQEMMQQKIEVTEPVWTPSPSPMEQSNGQQIYR